jgi:hypothetical protein
MLVSYQLSIFIAAEENSETMVGADKLKTSIKFC